MAGRWPVAVAHVVLHRRASQFPRRRTARFLGEPTEYVLNQVIDTVLGKDKDFLQWRAAHPESCVPRGVDRTRRSDTRRAPARLTVNSHGASVS